MAEPTTVDNGSLTDYDVAVDDLGADGVAGLAKLLVSADGSSARIPADAANGLDVDVTRVQGTVTVDGTVALSGTSPVSAASLPLPSGAATAAKQPALGVAGTPSSDVVSVQGVASGTVIPVSDGGGSLTVDGTVAVSGTVPVSDAGGTLSVDDGAGSLTVDGTVTANAGTGPWPVTDNGGSLTVDGTVAVSGTTAVSAVALPLPAGAATSAKQPALGTAGTASTDVVTVQGIASGTVIPVSDGGGSLTVDGTVAATQSGTWNVGTVSTVTNVVHVDDNAGTLSVDDGGGSITVDATSLPLPSGAATAAKQPALGTAGTASADVLSVQGVASMTALKVDGSAVTQPVSLSGGMAVTNAGTFAVQDSEKLADNAGFTDGTTKVLPVGYIFDNVAGTALTENDIAAARVDSKRAQAFVLEDGTTRAQVASVSAGGALKVDASGAAVPITDNSGSLTVDNGGTFAVQATLAAGATSIGKAEDVASADADVGVPAMGVRKASPANTSGTDGDYEMLQLSAGRLWVSATVDTALPAGTNAIGKLAANSGVDIGALTANQTVNVAQVNGVTTTMGNGASGTGVQRVTLANDSTGIIASIGTSVTPGTSAAHLGKAEDAAHTTGDTGVYALAVRSDTPTVSSDTTGDYSSLNVGARGELWVGLVRHDTRLEIPVTIAGLTASSTAYTAGDVMGSEMTFANAARISAGGGTLRKIQAINSSTQLGAVDLFLFDSASTPASDNAANSWSDANMAKCVAILPLVPTTSALNQVLTWVGDEDYSCAATSLFGVLVTRSAHTFFGAATDILVRMWVDRA